MRPVKKWKPDKEYSDDKGHKHVIKKKYNPYGNACIHLQNNIGMYCSYCEVPHPDLKVEHVVSIDQMENDPTIAITKYDWDNFLIACERCNGNSNIKDKAGNVIGSCKSNKKVDENTIALPHRVNTYHCLDYRESGEVFVKEGLYKPAAKIAQALIDLVDLNREEGLKPRDRRTELRRNTWDTATWYLSLYEDNDLGSQPIGIIKKHAKDKGFFSIWYTVFQDHPEVQQALVQAFPGTNTDYV